MRDGKHHEELKQIRLQIGDLDCELQRAARITDVYQLNSEINDINIRFQETNNDLNKASSRILRLEGQVDQIHVSERRLDAGVLKSQVRMGSDFKCYSSKWGNTGKPSETCTPEGFAELLGGLDQRLAHLEAGFGNIGLVTPFEHAEVRTELATLDNKLSSIENALLQKVDISSMMQVEQAVKVTSNAVAGFDKRLVDAETKSSLTELASRLLQLESATRDLACKVSQFDSCLATDGRLAALEATVQGDTLGGQLRELAAVVTTLEGTLKDSKYETDRKLIELWDLSQAVLQRIITNEHYSKENGSAAQVCELNSSVSEIRDQLGELETLLAECQAQLQKLHLEKLGKEHWKQLGSFVMSVQVQISDMEKKAQLSSSRIEDLKEHVRTMEEYMNHAVERVSTLEDRIVESKDLVIAVQQELQGKAGTSDLHRLDSSLMCRLASCDQAVEDKAASLDQLRRDVAQVQEEAAGISQISSKARSEVRELTHLMTQVSSSAETTKTDVQSLHESQKEILARIGDLEGSRNFHTPRRGPPAPSALRPQRPQTLLHAATAASHARGSSSRELTGTVALASCPAETVEPCNPNGCEDHAGNPENQVPDSPELLSLKSDSVRSDSPFSWAKHGQACDGN